MFRSVSGRLLVPAVRSLVAPTPTGGVGQQQQQQRRSRRTRNTALQDVGLDHDDEKATTQESFGVRTLDSSAAHALRTSTADAFLNASLLDVADDVIAHTDPALHVRLDPKSGRPLLSREQENLLWEARKEAYSKLQHKLKIALSSHHADLDKCHILYTLHSSAMKQRLRLTDAFYDELFHIYLVAHGPNLKVSADAGVVDQVWRMYRYMVDSGTDPTPKIIQHLMMLLDRVRKENVEIEAKAHALMLDNDRFKLMPTQFALEAYFSVCAVNSCMHIAVARYTDSRTRLQIAPTPGMCAIIIRGLLHDGKHQEAMTFVQTLDSVAVTDHLLNSVLQAARLSPDPSSCFSIFRALRTSGLPPSLPTISLLLETCFETGDFSEVPFILHLMKRFGLKGDERFSNKLLVALWRSGNGTLAERFERSMQNFGVRVYHEKVSEARRNLGLLNEG